MSEPNEKKDTPPGNGRLPVKGLIVWILLLALFLTMFNVFSGAQTAREKLRFRPDFVNLVEAGKVKSVTAHQEMSGVQYLQGELTEIDPRTQKPRQFRVDVLFSPGLLDWLRNDANVAVFDHKWQNAVLYQLVSGAIPFLIVLGLLYFLFIRQMKIAGKGAMSFGKSRARMLNRSRNKVTFQEVAGIEEAKEELEEVVDFLKDPKRFQKLGGRIPKGVLLIGPPGTGKTLLAKAIAGEADVPFFSISGSDFVEMFVGVGASRVRDMFEQGKKHAPCIIFIDEIDAVGRSRFSGIGGGHDEREQTLNALLVEMDGFDSQEGIIIIAATNRADVLDNALLRPGRFDRQVRVELPLLEGREEILRIHARRVKLSDTVDLRRIARGTPGFSGADLANLVNEAALLAARRGAKAVETGDLEEARDKVRWGRERRSRVLDENEKKLTAYHEAGHALAMLLCKHSEPLHKVTIIPRGPALGVTMQLPEKDRYTESQQKLEDMLVGLMGGRAAEEIVFGDVTTGAMSDLKQGSHIARLMVCEWGMSPLLGPQSFGGHDEPLFLGRELVRHVDHSDDTAQKIDTEISRILHESYKRSRALLTANRAALDRVAETLIERETLDGDDVADLVRHGRIRTPEERGDAPPPEAAPATEEEEAEPAAEPAPGFLPGPRPGPAPA